MLFFKRVGVYSNCIFLIQINYTLLVERQKILINEEVWPGLMKLYNNLARKDTDMIDEDVRKIFFKEAFKKRKSVL